MQQFLWGVALVAFGSVYLWKPNIFRRGIWMKTSIAIRSLSEDNYKTYMRGLGAVLIVVGLALILLALCRHLGLNI